MLNLQTRPAWGLSVLPAWTDWVPGTFFLPPRRLGENVQAGAMPFVPLIGELRLERGIAGSNFVRRRPNNILARKVPKRGCEDLTARGVTSQKLPWTSLGCDTRVSYPWSGFLFSFPHFALPLA